MKRKRIIIIVLVIIFITSHLLIPTQVYTIIGRETFTPMFVFN